MTSKAPEQGFEDKKSNTPTVANLTTNWNEFPKASAAASENSKTNEQVGQILRGFEVTNGVGNAGNEASGLTPLQNRQGDWQAPPQVGSNRESGANSRPDGNNAAQKDGVSNEDAARNGKVLKMNQATHDVRNNMVDKGGNAEIKYPVDKGGKAEIKYPVDKGGKAEIKYPVDKGGKAEIQYPVLREKAPSNRIPHPSAGDGQNPGNRPGGSGDGKAPGSLPRDGGVDGRNPGNHLHPGITDNRVPGSVHGGVNSEKKGAGLPNEIANENGRVLRTEQFVHKLTGNDPRQSHDGHQSQDLHGVRDKQQNIPGTKNQEKNLIGNNQPGQDVGSIRKPLDDKAAGNKKEHDLSQYEKTLADRDGEPDADDVLHDGSADKNMRNAQLALLDHADIRNQAAADKNLQDNIGNYLAKDARAAEVDLKNNLDKSQLGRLGDKDPRIADQFQKIMQDERIKQLMTSDQNMKKIYEEMQRLDRIKKDVQQPKIDPSKFEKPRIGIKL